MMGTALEHQRLQQEGDSSRAAAARLNGRINDLVLAEQVRDARGRVFGRCALSKPCGNRGQCGETRWRLLAVMGPELCFGCEYDVLRCSCGDHAGGTC